MNRHAEYSLTAGDVRHLQSDGPFPNTSIGLTLRLLAGVDGTHRQRALQISALGTPSLRLKPLPRGFA